MSSDAASDGAVEACAMRIGCTGAAPRCSIAITPTNGTLTGATATSDRNMVANAALSFAAGNSITLTHPALPLMASPRSMTLWMRSSQTSVGAMVNYGPFMVAQRFGLLVLGSRAYFVGQSRDLQEGLAARRERRPAKFRGE